MNPGPESPVAIVGSRDFPDLEMVRAFVRSLPKDACVVSGGARGVDQAAESEARNRRMTYVSYRPYEGRSSWRIQKVNCYDGEGEWYSWEPGEFGSFAKAAHTRNSLIVDTCVAESGSVVAFWDGKSKGTKSTIDKAQAAGILFAVYTPDSVAPST